jgi:hypothetical protein
MKTYGELDFSKCQVLTAEVWCVNTLNYLSLGIWPLPGTVKHRTQWARYESSFSDNTHTTNKIFQIKKQLPVQMCEHTHPQYHMSGFPYKNEKRGIQINKHKWQAVMYLPAKHFSLFTIRKHCIYHCKGYDDFYLLLLEHRLVWAYSLNQHEGMGDVDIKAVSSCHGQSTDQLLSFYRHPIQTFTEENIKK